MKQSAGIGRYLRGSRVAALANRRNGGPPKTMGSPERVGLPDITLSYNRWRIYNVENSLRFYAVRLNEVGMVRFHSAEDHPRRELICGS